MVRMATLLGGYGDGISFTKVVALPGELLKPEMCRLPPCHDARRDIGFIFWAGCGFRLSTQCTGVDIMRKIILPVILALAVLAALSACRTSGDGMSVAVVDAERVFKDCDAGKEGMQLLQGLNAKYEGTFQSLQQAMGQEKDKQKSAELGKQLQETAARYQAEMGKEQGRIIALLSESYAKVLKEYRVKNKIGVVLNLDAVQSHDETADITDKVIAALNALKLDLAAEPSGGEGEAPKTE